MRNAHFLQTNMESVFEFIQSMENSGTCGDNNTPHTFPVLLTETSISFLCKIDMSFIELDLLDRLLQHF